MGNKELVKELLKEFSDRDSVLRTNKAYLDTLIQEAIDASPQCETILQVRESIEKHQSANVELRAKIDSLMAEIKQTQSVEGVTAVWMNASKYDKQLLEEMSVEYPCINSAREYDTELLNVLATQIDLSPARGKGFQNKMLDKMKEAKPAKISDGYVTIRANRK